MGAGHDADTYAFGPSFPGLERIADLFLVQRTLVEGRALERKRGLCKRAADQLSARIGLRRQDASNCLTGTGKDDRSFRNGEIPPVEA